MRGNETRRAYVNWLETPTTRSDLDYEYGLLLDMRETMMRALAELESADSSLPDDGKNTRQAAEGIEAARKRVQLIAAAKSKLEEVDDRLRVLNGQQASLQDQSEVPVRSKYSTDAQTLQIAPFPAPCSARISAELAAILVPHILFRTRNQPTPDQMGVVEKKASRAEFLSEHLILGPDVLDHLLLLAVYRASENQKNTIANVVARNALSSQLR